ncbi:MAG TPA: peptidyl-prolyl cis-trans isomerase [Oceanospirillales bacterium]|nr:peptidyl-prolyl cis-trans isomerase [Oceanospirillales bacterium]
MRKIIILLVLLNSIGFACEKKGSQKIFYPDKTFPEVLIKTSMGDIVIELDRNRAPITVNNFLQYVESGAYKKTIFHRVEKGFVIQGGGYDEKYNDVVECDKIYNESGNGLRNTKGTIAMARFDDPHSATTQFFINLKDSPSLDPNPKNWGYAVFGEVVEGMDVVEKIGNVRVGFSSGLNAENVPNEPVTIHDVIVQ